MQFITSLLGDSGLSVLTYILALAFVLLLAVMGLWLLKFTVRGTTTLRGRNRRISVVEQVPVDARRQLLLIRRDGVEHLVLVGGPQDLVVESGIGAPRRRSDETAESTPAPQPLPASEEVPKPRPDLVVSNGAAERRPGSGRSLRHTGLLKPVSVSDTAVIPLPVAGDNSNRSRSDSAKKGGTEPVERIEAGDATRGPAGAPEQNSP